MSLASIQRHIRSLRDPERAVFCQRYFKTGKGEYGEGDRFLGLDAKTMHSLARQYRDTPLDVVETLLHSPWHEERLVALLILVEQFPKGDRDAIFTLYLANTQYINNWDLVDSSAPHIVGAHAKPALLRKLAKSSSVWERRIAVLASGYSIRQGDFGPTFTIARMLLDDRHDLIHKAVGWMLREVGKRDLAAEMRFLDEHAATMPRTMLRYAIEKMEPAVRKRYLSAKNA